MPTEIFLEEADTKEEAPEEESYYEGETEIMDGEYMDDDTANGNGDLKSPDYAIANVSCQYDGVPGT